MRPPLPPYLNDHTVYRVTPIRVAEAAQSTNLEGVRRARCEAADNDGFRTGEGLFGPCCRRSSARWNRRVTQNIVQRLFESCGLYLQLTGQVTLLNGGYGRLLDSSA